MTLQKGYADNKYKAHSYHSRQETDINAGADVNLTDG